MSSKKKILTIIIISLIVIAVAAITIKLVGDLNKETTLKNEVKEISKFMNINQNENDEINEILTRREITKGKYKNIENDIKQYYQVIYSDLQNFSFLIDNDNFNIYLSSENLNEDKPSFIKSKHIVLNIQTRPGQSGSPVFRESDSMLVAMIIGSYAPNSSGSISLGGVDPHTLHQTTHAVSAEYILQMLQ